MDDYEAILNGTKTLDTGLTSLTFGNNDNEIVLGTGVFAGSNLDILKTYTTIRADNYSGEGDSLLKIPFIGSNIGKLVITPTETQKDMNNGDNITNNNFVLANPTYAYISTIGELVLNEGITEIANGAFNSSKIDKINLPSTLTNIKNTAFRYTGITSLSLPNGLVKIGEDAFSGNSLTTVSIPKTVTEIGSNAFRDNPLTTVTLKGRSSTSGMTLGSNWNGTGTIVYQP